MSTENGRKPAFATDHPDDRGLTKREYFALHLLSGFLASCSPSAMIEDVIATKTQLAIGAVALADALLEELGK